MMKRLLFLCVLILSYISIKAQPYRNEWINYSQKYYKIKIAQNGVYRIDSALLANAGIPLDIIDPNSFQIFNNGVEQAIFIQGEEDHMFNNGDFIEFYAEKNDGKMDSLQYFNTSFLPNPYYSLINDTAVYFLTWNASISNKRLQVETDTAFSSYSPAINYFFKEEISSFHAGDYYQGEIDAAGATDTRYTRSEGWFSSNTFDLGASMAFTNLVNTSYAYSGGPNATIRTVVVGASKSAALVDQQHVADHHLRISYKGSSGSYQLFKDTLFKGFESNQFVSSISPSLLGNTFTDFNYESITDPNFHSNRSAVAYINVKYPHTFNMEGKTKFIMYLPDNPVVSQTKSYLHLNNFNASGAVRIYDLTNSKRIDVVKKGNSYEALIPNTNNEKKCLISSEGMITNITSLQPVTPNARFKDYSLLAVDSAFVIITNKLLLSSVAEYKNYRSSAQGGAFHVVVADIDDLYDQFAYGVVKSPLSIRGFMDYLLDHYPTQPQNLFLIGKSVHPFESRNNPEYSFNDPADYARCLVPTFGSPCSDNLLTAGLNGTVIAPAVATGRLAANNDQDVRNYLEKVEEYEDRSINPASEWMKNIIHFGGGENLGQQMIFKSYLNSYKAIAEDTLFGGSVASFFKNNSTPISFNSTDTIRDMINNGTSLMTFFGHGSSTNFDFSTDNVSTYHPAPGHYTFFLADGCYVGDIHTHFTTSTSESWILTPRKGAIGYIGTSSLGTSDALNVFTSEFYKQFSYLNYSKSIGSTFKRTIANMQTNVLNGDYLLGSACYEMTLHGDPSMVINSFPKPDYKITNNSVYVDLKTDVDSFTVYVIRANVGRATDDKSYTELVRTFPNGQVDTVLKIYDKEPKFMDTVSFKLRIDNTRGVGLNKIKVTLDKFQAVSELDETNNIANVDVLIPGGAIAPVYPYDFAIVPTDTITLKASTSNPFAPSQKYKFQIDTVDTFIHPLDSTTISASGGIVTWKPSIHFSDSTVYYWRVSPDSINAVSGFVWRQSSFQYLSGKRGWEQAHFFQFKNDGYQYVKYNRALRKFSFANDVITIGCVNGIPPIVINYDQVKFSINNHKVYESAFNIPSFVFALFDPISGQTVTNNLPLYGAFPAFEKIESDSVSRSSMVDFINAIPNNYYVLAYIFSDNSSPHHIPQYETAVRNAFQSLGSTLIPSNNVPVDHAYILWTKKNDPSYTPTELVGGSIDSIIRLNASINTNWTKGYIASPVIGPALSWDSLSWRQHTIDGLTTRDQVEIKLVGIKSSGATDTLATFNSSMTNIGNLSSYVDAHVYPNIRLIAFMEDDSLHSPPHLDRWQVIYSPVPEAAIDPSKGYTFTNDTLQEGNDIKLHLPIHNIGDYPFTDSLLVTYWLEDMNRNIHPLPYKLKKKSFLPNEVIIDTISLNTATYKGNNALWVEVNPVSQSHSQLEQYHFNNIVRIPFSVSVDKINPMLDVTFDGVHILNNDIVSSKPNILIKLKDENKFLALNDTNSFRVQLKRPGSNIFEPVYYGNKLTFTPAVLPNNSCTINYTPEFLQDGVYELWIDGKDRSNNQSGALSYKIKFEVVNRATITEVMNYPNPFSTATHFVFTLTGSEVPTSFKIQIMTITGKVVREITNQELGLLHIGRNITEYAWDGKDEFGDQLANGVYLYRIQTKLNGENIEKKETAADEYFKKGWGKMYLMR